MKSYSHLHSRALGRNVMYSLICLDIPEIKKKKYKVKLIDVLLQNYCKNEIIAAILRNKSIEQYGNRKSNE